MSSSEGEGSSSRRGRDGVLYLLLVVRGAGIKSSVYSRCTSHSVDKERESRRSFPNACRDGTGNIVLDVLFYPSSLFHSIIRPVQVNCQEESVNIECEWKQTALRRSGTPRCAPSFSVLNSCW